MLYVLVVIAGVWNPPAPFDVPAGPAEKTLLTWSRQAHLGIMYKQHLVLGLETLPVSGILDPLEALREMLKLTGLVIKQNKFGSVALTEDKNYCHPDWGALDAPLPPCVQKPLQVRVP